MTLNQNLRKMKRIAFLHLILFAHINCFANMEEKVTLQVSSGELYGTLLIPESETTMPVVLLISGSGPTDRDGNNPKMKNNSLKMLAESLAGKGVASLRYDKRGIGESKPAKGEESETVFTDFIHDVSGWIAMLNADPRFNQVYVAGHSEGSLLGMVASQHAKVDGFISIAGSGEPIDQTLKRQLSILPGFMKRRTYGIIDQIKAGEKTVQVPFYLKTLFKPELQPYINSWMQLDPVEEISKLNCRVLIAQGDRDIQVRTEDAAMLKAANKDAKLVIVKGMNHILKEAPEKRSQNLKTYKNPNLPVCPDFLDQMTRFILNEDVPVVRVE